MWRVAIAVCALGAASTLSCLATDSIRCGERLCPADTVCVAELQSCFPSDQIEACRGLEDGSPCQVDGADAMCSSGVCATAQCGDGLVTPPEACDGLDLDGQTCLSLGYYEGASVSCRADCTFDESQCLGRCGDGVVNGPEFCDSGPPTAFDCSNFAYDYGVLDCSSICAPTTDACVRFGLAGIQPPVIQDLIAVSGPSADDVYIMTRGELYRSDGVDGWLLVDLPSPPAVGLNDIDSDASTTWLVGAGGYVVRVDDGVAAVVSIPTTDDLVEVHAIDATNVWVGGATVLYHYDGANWTDRTADSGGSGPFGAFWSDSPTLLYVGHAGGLLEYDGAAFAPVAGFTRPITAIGGSDPNTVYVAEWDSSAPFPGEGVLYRKAGASWDNLGAFGRSFYNPDTAEAPIVAIEVPSPTDAFALVANPSSPTSLSTLLHFDGNRFSEVTHTSSSVRRPFDLFAPSATDILVLADGLRHYAGFGFQDGPATTTQIGGVLIAGVAALPTGDLFVSLFTPVPNAGGVLQSDGRDWTGGQLISRTADVSGRSASEVYVAHAGGVQRYDGDGWTPSLVSPVAMRAVAAGDRVLAGNNNGEISEFDGQDWTALTDVGVALASATPIPGGAVFASADQVFVVDEAGVTPLDPGIAPSVMWASSASDIYVASGGAMQRWNGEAWLDVDLGQPVFGIHDIGGTSPDDLWVLTEAAGGSLVLHYDGVAFSRVVVPGHPRAVAVTPRYVAFFEIFGGETTGTMLKRPAP